MTIKNFKIKYLLVFLTIVGIVAGVYFLFFRPKSAEAEWFNDEWYYRKKVELANSGTAQTDFQVMITLDTASLYSAGKIQSDCDDIRITDITGKLLPHWLEPTTCNTASTKIWTKVPSIATTGQTIYIYYGNPSATSVSSTTNTFIREISNVQGAWTMDEANWTNDCSTNTVTDSSNNANHGKSCPAGTGPLGGAAGKFGNGGSFDGNNDYVNAGNNSSLALTTVLSLEAWVYTQQPDSTATRILVGKLDPGTHNTGYALTIRYINAENGTDLELRIENGVTAQVGNIVHGWKHIVGTYDSSLGSNNLKIYVNGVLWSQGNKGNDLDTGTNNLVIGGSTTDRFFNGTIDDVRIYNKALSQAEITDLYGTGGDRQGYTTTNYPNIELVRKYSSSVSVGSAGTEEKGPGPVAYWRFDEGYGDTTYDDSVNNNDGTRGGGTADYKPTWQTEDMCVSGKCLRYDGVNDYVDTGSGASLTGFKDFTYELWVKLNTLNVRHSLVGAHSTQYHMFFVGSNNTLAFGFRDNSVIENNVITTDTLSQGIWYHLVGVRNTGSTLKIYINGVENKSSSAPGSDFITVTNPTLIGKYQWSPYYYLNGFIDDVRIYNYARTAAQIKTDYLAGMRGGGDAAVTLGATNQKYLSDGLVGYWKMDESSWTNDCSTSTVTDSSGAGNNGISCPNGTGPTGGAAGKFGNAGSFDSVDDYVSVTDSTSLDITSAITIGTWINPITIDHSTFVSFVRKGNDAYWLQFQNNGTQLSMAVNTTSGLVKTDTSISKTDYENKWNHIVGVYDGSKVLLYINGTLLDSDPQTGTIITNNDEVLIGKAPTAEYFKGLIDDVRIYNRALSAKEVRDLYNWAPGPVGHWKMDEKVSGNSQTIYDHSTYGNNGTTYWGGNASGMDCRVPGEYGTACQFDGTDDYVTGSLSLSANADFTLEAWINTNLLSTEQHFVTITGVQFFVGNNKLSAGGANAVAIGATTLSINRWYHAAVTHTNADNTFTLYLNGNSDGSGAQAVGAVSNFWIGRLTTLGYYFSGLIDDVRIYNYARSQKQILEDMNAGHPASGSPVGSYAAYWKFDEGYSNIAYDMSGNNNDGTLQPGAGGGNTQAYQMWDNNGKFNKAIEFDGTDDRVSCGSSASLTGMTIWTVEGWAKITSANNEQVFVGFNANDNNSHNIVRDYGGTKYTHLILGTNYYRRWYHSPIDVDDGNWHHVVFVVDSTNILNSKFYADGREQIYYDGENSGSATTKTGCWIGSTGEPLRFLGGLIDEVKIYPFALTEDEIRTEYNKGAALKFGSISTDSGGSTASDAASRGYCVPGDTTSCNGPVGEWKMDEKTGANAYDTSGNGNTGTITSAAWATGKYGSALSFDGDNDYVNCGTGSSLDMGTGDFTAEAWIKRAPMTASEIEAIAGKAEAQYALQAGQRGWWLVVRRSGGLVYVYLQVRDENDNTTDGSYQINVTDNQWHHIVGVKTSSGVRIWVDNVPGTQTTATFNSTIDSLATSQYIGNDQSSARDFNGLIDDVRIYNYARTPAQIAWDYNRGRPVGWWKFDECQGGTAYDMSDNNNDGTITIGATGTQDGIGTCTDGDTSNAWYNGRTGKYNSALNFDGTDDYVTAPLSASLKPKRITLSLWWQAQSQGATYQYILDNYNDSPTEGNCIQIRPDLGGFNTTFGSVAYDKITSYTFIAGNWYHIVATYDGSNVITYVNGVQKGIWAIAGSPDITYDRGAFNIGRQNNSGYYTKGLIDDVKIYNYALTPLQIKTEYNQGSAIRFGPSTGSP